MRCVMVSLSICVNYALKYFMWCFFVQVEVIPPLFPAALILLCSIVCARGVAEPSKTVVFWTLHAQCLAVCVTSCTKIYVAGSLSFYFCQRKQVVRQLKCLLQN